MKDWRSSPSADAEGASFNKTNLSGKRTVFFDSFCMETMRFVSNFVFSSEKIRLTGLFTVLFFEEKKEKNHGRISCKSS